MANLEDFKMANLVGRQHTWFELQRTITGRNQNHLSRAIRGKGERWASVSLCLHLLGKKEGVGSWDTWRETCQWMNRWVSCVQTQCMECGVLQETGWWTVAQRRVVELTDWQNSLQTCDENWGPLKQCLVGYRVVWKCDQWVGGQFPEQRVTLVETRRARTLRNNQWWQVWQCYLRGYKARDQVQSYMRPGTTRDEQRTQ